MIFGFVGITAQLTDITLELREAAIATAIEAARSLAADFEWDVVKESPGTENSAELKPKPLQ